MTPEGYDNGVTMSRARDVVKLAATKTEVEYVREWLTRDERGTWERDAERLLALGAERAPNMPVEELNDAAAIELVFTALTALQRRLEKGSL